MDAGDAREAAILEASLGVFRRYGFKKTSMDDLARAAGLSRQGLYLHFPTKEALFKAALERVFAATEIAGRAAFARDDLDVEERILEAFVVMHGHAVGTDGAESFAELLAAASQLMGPRVAALEAGFVAGITRMLKSSGVAASWKASGVSVKQLADVLFAVSAGAKQMARGPADYRETMRVAVRVVCDRRG